MTRRPLLVLAMFALPFALVACGSEAGDPKNAHISAGGLPESRLPVGPRGDSPPPTAAVPRDYGPKGLEAGWYKRAGRDEKAPTTGDRPSLLSARGERKPLLPEPPTTAFVRRGMCGFAAAGGGDRPFHAPCPPRPREQKRRPGPATWEGSASEGSSGVKQPSSRRSATSAAMIPKQTSRAEAAAKAAAT